MNNQPSHIKYLGFTLVEVMVVILIITLLLGLGNFGGLFSRRENARIEELAVNIVGLLDEEKTNALLGKTEGGKIVRKRQIGLTFGNPGEITYTSKADLAEDAEDSFLSPITTKTWTLTGMSTALWKCDIITGVSSLFVGPASLTIIMENDTMNITVPAITEPHLIFRITRNNVSRDVNIDKRTGLTYERAGDPDPLVSPSCV